MKPRALFNGAPPAVVQSVPCCVMVGVAVSVPISYHLAPMRRVFPVVAAAQVVLVSTECAVHNDVVPLSLFLWMEAMKSRRSETSRLVAEPEACCADMFVFVTANVTFAPSVGVPPGFETLRMLIRLRKPGSVPMMYPSVQVGSSLSTPRGA